MSQPFTFQAANNRSPLRIGQIIFTVLALLSFALGSVLLSLVWPATMLAVWIFSTLALILAKRWLLASLSLPVAFAILYGIWWFMAVFLLNISGVMFAALFMLLNTGAVWLARWFLKKHAKGNV